MLKHGQPIVAAARVEHTGTFNMGEGADRWKPFTSTQRVVTRRPGFDWDAVDDHSAHATLKDGDITLTLLFRFNEEGLIDTVFAESRAQIIGGKVTHAPWKCRVWNYAIRDGMRVPLDGEAAWMMAEGAKPYWRGHINTLSYEFAQ